MKEQMGFSIEGSCKDCDEVINKLIAENPDMTIQEYLDKHCQDILILK